MSRSWAALGQSLKTALLWTPVAITVNDVFIGAAVVNGHSMQPTLNPGAAGSWRDRIIIDKLSSRIFTYERGDVVLIRSPRQPRTVLVKRLVGLEGDWLLAPGRKDIVKIPKGHCWIEGDNSGCSEDSATAFGPVPMALIQGRVIGVFWPPSRLQKVSSRVPHGRLLMRNDVASHVKIVD